jgi:hypothetical protein
MNRLRFHSTHRLCAISGIWLGFILACNPAVLADGKKQGNRTGGVTRGFNPSNFASRFQNGGGGGGGGGNALAGNFQGPIVKFPSRQNFQALKPSGPTDFNPQAVQSAGIPSGLTRKFSGSSGQGASSGMGTGGSSPMALKSSGWSNPWRPCTAKITCAPKHCHAPLTLTTWCHYHPVHCHWWFNYCHGLHTCLPTHYIYYDWTYVWCRPMVNGVVWAESYSWYLGCSGMLLPDSGLGVDAVAAHSPAERAGLRPGMVILEANGIKLVSEDAMRAAIESSGGVLQLLVIEAEGAQPVIRQVQMQLVRAVRF